MDSGPRSCHRSTAHIHGVNDRVAMIDIWGQRHKPKCPYPIRGEDILLPGKSVAHAILGYQIWLAEAGSWQWLAKLTKARPSLFPWFISRVLRSPEPTFTWLLKFTIQHVWLIGKRWWLPIETNTLNTWLANLWRRCLQVTMITHGHSGRLTSSLAHKYYENSHME